jgi:hypothetical protein
MVLLQSICKSCFELKPQNDSLMSNKNIYERRTKRCSFEFTAFTWCYLNLNMIICFKVENLYIAKEEPSAALSSLQLLHGVTSINM